MAAKNTLNQQDVIAFNKLLDELNAKRKKLNQDPLLNLKPTVENLVVVNDLLDSANDTLGDLAKSISGIRESWSGVVGEIQKSNDLSKSFCISSGVAIH